MAGFGVELKRHGANLAGRCPFHDDRTPSLIVTPETNLWRCMGKCNIGGSTIDWVMKTRGVSFRHAVELLCADHPSLAAGDGRVIRRGTTVKLESPVTLDADDQETLRDVVSFYHETLVNSPESLRYLESRGLKEELLKLGIGTGSVGVGKGSGLATAVERGQTVSQVMLTLRSTDPAKVRFALNDSVQNE